MIILLVFLACSLKTMSPGLIHVVKNDNASFFFMDEQYPLSFYTTIPYPFTHLYTVRLISFNVDEH